MLERLIAWLWTLLAYLSPQVSELGDEYDNFPIPEHPSEVIAEPSDGELDEDASDPANSGIDPRPDLTGSLDELRKDHNAIERGEA